MCQSNFAESVSVPVRHAVRAVVYEKLRTDTLVHTIMRVSRCYRIPSGILFLRGHFCLILLYYFPSSCNRLSMLATCERCYVAHPDHWLSLHAARMRRDVAIASLLPTRDLSGYDNFSLYISFPSTPTKLFPSHSWTSLLNDPSRAHLPCLSLAVRVCVRRA